MVTPLAVPIQAASPTSSAAAATGSSSATQMTSATISGVAVGSVAGVAVIAILIAFCYRQRRKKIERLQNLQIQTHMLVQSKASIFASRNSSQTSNFWEHPKQMAHAKSPHFQANGTENGQGAMEYAISPQSPVVPVRLANCLFDHRSLEEFSLDDEDEEPPPPPASVQGLSPPSRSPMRPDRTRESGQPVAFLGQAPEANRTFSHHSNDPDNVSVAHPRFDFESDDEPESEYEQYGGYAVGEIGGLLRFGNQLGKDPDLALSLANKKSIGSFMIPNTLAGGPFPASGLNQRRYFPENREEDKHELEGTLPMQSNEAQNQVPILRKPIPRQGRGGGRIYVP
ncbi:MAG: hypothetical protein M1818_007735 [Claussenomyces sp. TS43310]|nr:MAG: hypothetical protein M1818_007735 [Claussenomyces sp. TS43310]